MLLVFLNFIPLGQVHVNRCYVGPLRADYFLHILAFIPWMAFFPLGWRLKNSSNLNGYIRWICRWRYVPKDHLCRGAAWAGLGIVLAVAVEGVQYFLSYRSFNPQDALFSALGVTVGAVLWFFANKLFSR